MVQSALTMHDDAMAQPGHVEPPQSVSVSAPFRMPSAQLPCWQSPLLHTCVEQSVGAKQAAPGAQAAQAVPPQSVSVSLPFLTPSVQLPRASG